MEVSCDKRVATQVVLSQVAHCSLRLPGVISFFLPLSTNYFAFIYLVTYFIDFDSKLGPQKALTVVFKKPF